MSASRPGIQRDWQQKLTGCFYGFGGINNVIDPSNLDIEKGELVDAVNVDLDNTNSASRRAGYVRRLAGNYHSGWSNDSNTLSYFVSDSIVYEWDGVNVPIPIEFLSSNNRCEFCQVNNVVAFSNGIDFGVIGEERTQTRTYSEEYKRNTLGGRNLEFYNGRLYFSRSNTLYYTDNFDVEHMDARFNKVATLPHTITMCKRVEDGLWVGTEKFVYFFSGDDPREGGFRQHIVAKSGVVYGTACKTNATYLPEAQTTNNVVVFLTSQGICSGGNGGKFTNHSFNTVSIDAGLTGSATIRTEHGISQYIVCFDTDSGVEYNPYSIEIPLQINTI